MAQVHGDDAHPEEVTALPRFHGTVVSPCPRHLASRLCAAIGLAPTALVLLFAGACTRISVSPDCPDALDVSDTVQLHANAVNQGGIATFAWSVSPTTAGEFANPDRADTAFEAKQAGAATIVLQASDGLFIDGGACQIEIGAGGVTVHLEFAPQSPETGDTVTLTCTSIGGTPAEELSIEQTSGPDVELTPESDGVVSFTADASGTYAFECIGADAGGADSEPDSVEFTVRSGRPPRG